MYCERCGFPLDENGVCRNCSTQQNAGNGYYQNTPPYGQNFGNYGNYAPAKNSGKAIAGFVLSIVGIFIFGLICGILGLIFSGLGMKEASMPGYKGKGLAIAGLVISAIDVVFVFAFMGNILAMF